MKKFLLTILSLGTIAAVQVMAQTPEFPSGLDHAAGAPADEARSWVRDARKKLNDSQSDTEQALRSVQAMLECAGRSDVACMKGESTAIKDSMARATAINSPLEQQLLQTLLKPSLYKDMIKLDLKRDSLAWMDAQTKLQQALQQLRQQTKDSSAAQWYPPSNEFTIQTTHVANILEIAYGPGVIDGLLAAINGDSPFTLRTDLPRCLYLKSGEVTNAPCQN